MQKSKDQFEKTTLYNETKFLVESRSLFFRQARRRSFVIRVSQKFDNEAWRKKQRVVLPESFLSWYYP